MSFDTQRPGAQAAARGRPAAAPASIREEGTYAPSSSSSSRPWNDRQEQVQARSAQGRTEAELLREAKRNLLECDDIATGALGTLNTQTEQLARIQADSQCIDHNLNQSERLLKGMKPWRGLTNGIRSLFGRPPKEDGPAPAGPSPAMVKAQVAADRQKMLGGYNAAGAGPSQPGGYGSRHTGAAAAVARANASQKRPAGPGGELDKEYDDIDNLLDGLKHKSSVINQTLGLHNQVIDDITHDVSRDQARMRKQNDDMRKMLGK